MAAVFSPFASSAPDGLERVAEDQGILDRISELWTLSPLPDYSVSSISDSVFSTSLAGIIGVVVVFAVSYIVYKILNYSFVS